MFRPEIKVLDCTVRDGGLMNKWQFDDAFVRKVYENLNMSGIDYMEIGYISSEKAFSRKEVGPWKFCAEADIRRVTGRYLEEQRGVEADDQAFRGGNLRGLLQLLELDVPGLDLPGHRYHEGHALRDRIVTDGAEALRDSDLAVLDHDARRL